MTYYTMPSDTNIPETAELEEQVIAGQWFANFIRQVKADDELIASTNVSPEKKHQLYNVLAGGLDDLAYQVRVPATNNIIKMIVFDYWAELREKKDRFLKLGLAHADSKIFVWAEIEDDDESSEDLLLISEAKVNAKYFSKGFNIISTIVEKSDNIPLPKQYLNLLD